MAYMILALLLVATPAEALSSSKYRDLQAVAVSKQDPTVAQYAHDYSPLNADSKTMYDPKIWGNVAAPEAEPTEPPPILSKKEEEAMKKVQEALWGPKADRFGVPKMGVDASATQPDWIKTFGPDIRGEKAEMDAEVAAATKAVADAAEEAQKLAWGDPAAIARKKALEDPAVLAAAAAAKKWLPAPDAITNGIFGLPTAIALPVFQWTPPKTNAGPPPLPELLLPSPLAILASQAVSGPQTGLAGLAAMSDVQALFDSVHPQ